MTQTVLPHIPVFPIPGLDLNEGPSRRGTSVIDASTGAAYGDCDTSRAGLSALVAQLEALVKHRFEGPWNLGPRLLALLGPKGKRTAYAKLEESKALLATVQGNTAEPEVARRIVAATREGFEGGTRRHDAFIDDITEYGVSNAVGLASTAFMEKKYEAMEARGEVRWDAPGNWKGTLKALPYLAVPYYLGIAGARGKNFIGIAEAEVEATVMMVAGSHLLIMALEKHAQLGTSSSALLGSAIAGFGAGAWCYWRADKASVNTSLLKAGLRAAFNVCIRMGLGRVLFRKKKPRLQPA